MNMGLQRLSVKDMQGPTNDDFKSDEKHNSAALQYSYCCNSHIQSHLTILTNKKHSLYKHHKLGETYLIAQ